MSEKLCLKWADFQGNINTALGSLRQDPEFSDVTLACEDGQQVEAHKVLLAASSPFFQNLLRKNKHPHPLIYMRGVKSEDLVAIVDFLYYGEANVYQENIDAFLKVADELSLKGLTGNKNNEEVENKITKPQKILSKPVYFQTPTANQSMSVLKEEIFEMEKEEEGVEVAASHDNSRNIINNVEELEQVVRSMMVKSKNNYQHGSYKALICTVCGKEGAGNAIKDHIEANHMEGVSLPCNFCAKTFRSRNGLRLHSAKNHK